MNLVLPIGRYCLRLFARDRPVPVRWIRLLRALCYGVHDPLFLPYKKCQKTGRLLRNPFLAQFLEKTEMGTWSLCPTTLDLLEEEIRNFRPKTILEFGSGISTTCLARYMFELHGVGGSLPYVFSVEQSHECVSKTRELLDKAGLSLFAQVFHAPLSRIAGLSCYTLEDGTSAAIRHARPDLIVIDGPSAEDGARYATLLAVLDLVAPRARFYLDDALRDGEIQIAAKWSAIPSIRFEGVWLTDKGLLIAQLGG